MKRKQGNDIFIDDDGSQIGYFKVANDFLLGQADLSGNAVKIYLYLIWKAGSNKSTRVKVSRNTLKSYCKIKDRSTITRAVRELANIGWIKNIEPQIDNSLIYTVSAKNGKINTGLLKWLDERTKKHSKNSKKNIKSGIVVRGEDGKFKKGDDNEA